MAAAQAQGRTVGITCLGAPREERKQRAHHRPSICRRGPPLTVLQRYLGQLHVSKRGVHAGGVEQRCQPLLLSGALEQGWRGGEGRHGGGDAARGRGCAFRGGLVQSASPARRAAAAPTCSSACSHSLRAPMRSPPSYLALPLASSCSACTDTWRQPGISL